MREKRRYILARVDPPALSIDGRDLYYAIMEAAAGLFGDTGVARIQPSVMSCTGGYAIIRCTRSAEGDLSAALAAVHSIHDRKAAIRSMLTSGTMRSLHQHLGGIRPVPLPGDEEVAFDGRSYSALKYQGTKVDLFEKGFKNQELLFLTAEDLEE